MNLSERWKFVEAGCPDCGAKYGSPSGLHHHSLSVWCLRCGWSRNWDQLKPRDVKNKATK